MSGHFTLVIYYVTSRSQIELQTMDKKYHTWVPKPQFYLFVISGIEDKVPYSNLIKKDLEGILLGPSATQLESHEGTNPY